MLEKLDSFLNFLFLFILGKKDLGSGSGMWIRIKIKAGFALRLMQI